MANAEILKRGDSFFQSSIFDLEREGENVKSRGQLIERKIDILENLAGKVSNRRSRRWLNDRLLIELVPRLNVEEIRGLFAPPPWGDDTPSSAFSMASVGEWDTFRNVDMDAEAMMIKSMELSSGKRKGHVDNDKVAALNAWHRVGCRIREALRRSSLSDLVAVYEERIRAFINDSGDAEVLVLHVQDPLKRLVLHGVCEFYNLMSVTVTTTRGVKLWKTTTIKRRLGSSEVDPSISLSSFLKMLRNGVL